MCGHQVERGEGRGGGGGGGLQGSGMEYRQRDKGTRSQHCVDIRWGCIRALEWNTDRGIKEQRVNIVWTSGGGMHQGSGVEY